MLHLAICNPVATATKHPTAEGSTPRTLERLRPIRLVMSAFVSITLLAGCGNPVKRKVEQRIASALPSIIGPAQSYQVSTSGTTLRMVKGKLSSVHITGRQVELPNGIRLAELIVEAGDLTFDTLRHRLAHAGPTRYSAIMSEAELNRYLVKTYPSIPKLRVELRDDGMIHLEGEPAPAGVAIRVSAEARLKIKDQRLLLLDLTTVRVIGMSTPAFAREYIESRVNPVFDSASFDHNARITKVQVMKARLHISGSLDLLEAFNAGL